MQLFSVEMRNSRAGPEAEPRVAIVIAGHELEAEELCRAEYGPDGFDQLRVAHRLGGFFHGPPRVLGYSGWEAHWLGEQDRD